jgi:2'-5' RNA ligase
MAELRLFVACELPDAVRDGLRRVQSDLRRDDRAGLRWVRPEGIHLTLKFLGGVAEERLGDVRSALAAAIGPFELHVRPATVGSFPASGMAGGARLRVVWVGLAGDVEGLAALAGQVDGALAPLGFPRERRPFAAHLTLARVPDGASAAQRRVLSERVAAYRMPDLPSMRLTKVALVRSILSPGGSVYERLAEFP